MPRHQSKRKLKSLDTEVLTPQSIILAASVTAMHWRLQEAATRVVEAGDAIESGQQERVMERLFAIEPLLYETGRILSGMFVLASDPGAGLASSHRSGDFV